MAGNNRATQDKRARERARAEKQQEKREVRVARKGDKELRREGLPEGEDPDLVGIIAGPQPPAEE